jgi:hypothetical protein
LQHAFVDIYWRGNEPITVEYNGKELKYKKRNYLAPPMVDSKILEMVWVTRRIYKPPRKLPWR